jgi:DNA modification methylase
MKQYHKNPRRISEDDLADLRRWLAELGDLSGIVHDLNSDEIIGGNQRGRVFDINQCEIVLVDGPHEPDEQGTVAHGFVLWQGKRYAYRQVRWTPRQCEQANIVANQAGGDWDALILASEFQSADLLEWGFEKDELDELLRAAGVDAAGGPVGEPGDAEPDIDRAEELAAEWGTALGQLWRLESRVDGQFHLLACGDSTDAAVVQRLMGDERAALFATDPPYLVDYDGMNHPQSWKEPRQKNKNKDWSATYTDWDSAAQGVELYEGFIGAAVAHAIRQDAAWYCWHASRRQAMLEAVWERHGAFVHQQIVWAKDRPVLTRSHYMWQHEPCFFGWVRPHRPPRVVDEWLSTVWEFPTQAAFERTDHPTQKPVELFQIPMTQHTRPGEICYEPFSGSGTQIVAGENLGRQVRAIELAPAFTAVALDRYLRAFEIRGVLVDG